MSGWRSDQIEENKVGGEYSMYGKAEKCIQNFGRKTWREETRKYFRNTGWEGVDWMQVAQERDKWRALVNTAVNFRVP